MFYDYYYYLKRMNSKHERVKVGFDDDDVVAAVLHRLRFRLP